MTLGINIVETVSTTDYLVASAAPYPLAQFEVDAMILIRRLAQKHLDSMALTASAGPGCHDASCAPPPAGTGGSKLTSRTVGRVKLEGPLGSPLTEAMLSNPVGPVFLTLGTPDTFSGYKAHIYAEDVDGIVSILGRLQDEIFSDDNPGGWGVKTATQSFFDKVDENHQQRGKAVTVYFPHKATWKKDLDYLVQLMAGLPPRQRKPVASEEYVDNGVSFRYELRKDAPDHDLDYSEYHRYYQASFELDEALTAAAIDPTTMITPEMEAEYLALATSLWDNLDNLSEGFGLDTLPWEMYAPLIVQAIETSRNSYIDILKALIYKQAEEGTVYGEYFLVPDYIPGTGLRPPAAYLVQFGDIRDSLSALGGGSADPTTQLTTGITGGSVYGQVLQDNGLATNDKLWLYGETVRRTFNGHLQMDGLVFSDWEDPALDIAPQDRWLRTLKYRPGDHWGCACVVVPYIPNFGEPFTMTIQASAVEEFYTPGQPRDREGQWASHRGRITSLASESIERVHGKGIKSMFPHGGLTTTTPWPSAPRMKGKPAYDSDLVQRELAKPAVLEKVDPRLLYATQPGLAREHVDYYLSGAYEHDGKTSADRSNSANAFPVVYVRNDGRMLILAGHHRAAAALLEGRDLEARMIHEP